jgi:L-seryl-tRNA(Ser) seleniumtransferase
MIRQSEATVRSRAEELLRVLPAGGGAIVAGESVIGGGATPEQRISTALIALTLPDVVAAERQLRTGEPPVVARIEGDRLVLDLRTVLPEEEKELAAALQALSW